jgi:hypothetical protein
MRVVMAFDIDLRQQLVDPRWQPPVAITEQLHRGWHQNHTHDRCVNEH